MTTTLRPDEYIDKHGRKRRRIGTVPNCSCCGAKAKVLMEIGVYRDDWIIADCDTCRDYVCENCHDVVVDPDDDLDVLICTLCLETAARQDQR